MVKQVLSQTGGVPSSKPVLYCEVSGAIVVVEVSSLYTLVLRSRGLRTSQVLAKPEPGPDLVRY